MLSLAAATAVGRCEPTSLGELCRSRGVNVGRWQPHGDLADVGGNDGALPSTEGADTEIGAPGVEET